MSEIPEFILKHVHKVAESEGFVDYKTKVEAGSKHGDGFLGILKRVIINGTKQSPDGQPLPAELHLVCKSVPTNKVRRHEFQCDNVFEREARMYDTVLPLLAEFQREKGLAESDSFTTYPKCYQVIFDEQKDELVIILEDLKQKGFTMWPKAEIVPANHAYILLENLAKLHAVSFALKDQRPEVFAKLKNVNDLLCNFFKNDAMVKILHMGYDRASACLKNPEHLKIVQRFKNNTAECFLSCLRGDACEPYGVITHGDCWINNLLFRYEDGTTNPLEISLVDWQLARYCSPVLDLYYFFATSTDRALRKAEYANLLTHYHNTLADAIRRLGSDPEKLFSRAAFDKELKRLGNMVFLMGLWMMQMMLADASDIPDIDQLTEDIVNSEKIDVFQNQHAAQEQEYDRRINELFEDFVELGYYTDE